MEPLISSHLTALETALSTLTDSITSYNPSIPAAHAILKADADLQSSLIQLAQHQRNTHRITSLRETITAQNDAITAKLTQLVEVRRELLDIPTSLPQRERREVTHGEVLDYAKRIARFTVPVGLKPAVISNTVKSEEGEEGGGVGGEEVAQQQPSEGKGMASLEDFEKQWLDPWTGVQFTPWPGEEVIKRGALGEIQAMLESGVDPATAAAEVGGGDKDEEEDLDMGEARAGGAGQAQMMRAPQKKEEQPKVFGGLDLYDPDEEG